MAEPLARDGLIRALDAAGEAIYLLRASDGQVVDASARACATLGTTREELIGQPAASFSATAALGWERVRDRVRGTAGPVIMASVHHGRDGVATPVDVTVTELSLDGELLHLVVARPQRSSADRSALRDLHYEAAFARSRDAILLHAPWGPIIDANAAAVSLFGYDRAALLQLDTDQLKVDLDVEREQREVIIPLLERGEARFEVRLRRRDGSAFWADVSATRLDFPAGIIVQALIRDITTAREQVERLSQAARVFESLAEGVMVTRLDGTITQVNPAFTHITGYEAHEVLGHNPRLLKSGHHDDAFYGEIWATLAERGRWKGEVWNRRKDGTVYPERLTISVVRDQEGRPQYYASVMSDITQIKETEQQLDVLAHHDALTGVPNRLRFLQRLDEALEHAPGRDAGRDPGRERRVGVVFVDVDHFKDINDALGHAAGDALLRAVADRLAGVLRDQDMVARLGGDEFVLLLEGVRSIDHAALVAARALEALRSPVRIEGRDVRVTASLGVSVWPDHAVSAEALMKHADLAMYKVKEAGRNGVGVYTPELSARLGERCTFELALRGAVERGEFSLAWQPQVALDSGQPLVIEALLRWSHPVVGAVAPTRFIPVAEWIGVIVPIGAWVLREACAAARRWRDAGLAFERVAVNVASRETREEGFAAAVLEAVAAAGIACSDLMIEVTERALREEPLGAAVSLNGLERLRRDGVRVAIDDFGTGYSSLGRLKDLPIDALKIDPSFIAGLPDAGHDRAIALAIVALARSLGLAVTAEGIETAGQAAAVRALGCDRGQGYHLARPMPEGELVAWLRARS